MFGFLKNLLRKSQDTTADSVYETATEEVGSDAMTPEPQMSYTAPAPTRATRFAPAQSGLAQGGGRGVEISLQSILNNLPLELQPRVLQPDVGDLTITIPLEKVLAQLSRGSVKISFGELRQAAPEVFTAENDRDRVLVALPLSDILSRLNPALITRRRVQRQVEVPADISSPFDGSNQVFAVAPEAEPAPASARPAPMAPRRAPVAPAAPAAPMRTAAPVNFAPPTAPAAPEAIPMTPFRQKLTAAPSPIAPEAPAIPATPIAQAPAARPPMARPPVAKAPPAQAPISMAPHAPIQMAPQPPIQMAPPAARPAAPALSHDGNGNGHAAPGAPAAGKSGPQGEPLVVSVAAIADGWPEAVRKEIVELNLVEARVALPLSAVEQSLKHGRIAFSWKTLRSWIKPAVLPAVSAHDGVVLELPLKVVAPLFLTRQQEAAKQQAKVTVDEEIPNLFFGFPRAEAPAAAPTAKPADTNFYVWGESSDTAIIDQSDVKRASSPSPGTRFVAKYATPNEVVSRAAGLDGVLGALIALPDGLMVANRLPPELNADTLAAFLPQIFGKVSQCTKELRMGELNNLNFTVGNVPWKIFRVNSIFFAAFGKAGEPLPTAQLAALAAELDHKQK